jgi:hypothetical protein
MLATIMPAFDCTAADAADWTAVTLARSGAWGISTAPMRGAAIAGAIQQCRAMTQGPSDCGAHYIVRRGAWIVGLVCGDQQISVAAPTLEDAMGAARSRRDAVGAVPAGDLTKCTTILVVTPTGASAVPHNMLSND